MKIKSAVFILFLIGFFGCKNDLVINAPYKDVAVIYSFLDQNEPIQYLRIQKLYQNSVSSSTAEGAQITDSLYFDTLVVDIINANTKDTFHCYRVDTIPKDKGFFSNARNTLYATVIPKNNAANELYQLRVVNPKNNMVFTSQTNLVKNANIEYRKIAIRLTPNTHSFSFKFTPGLNAALYDLIVRYQYKEMNINDTNVFEIKNVDYFVAKGAPINSTLMNASVSSREFLDYLISRIPADNTKKRRSLDLYFQAYGGSYAFANMMELTSTNISVVQKNPEYSNINNGLGIFTSRNFVQLRMATDPSTMAVIEGQLPNF